MNQNYSNDFNPYKDMPDMKSDNRNIYSATNNQANTININDYIKHDQTPSNDLAEDKTEENVDYSSISKTKIININDFIFRQNLEFYPNLHGLKCADNVLSYYENGNIVTSEVLTFDLRTLPGEAWNVSPKEFLEIIKINKSCKNLLDFINILNQSAFDQVVLNKEELENQISNYMNLYFSVKEDFNNLTEDNKILTSNIENLIATLPKETVVGSIVNKKLDDYFEMTKTLGDEKGKTMALVLKNKQLPSLIEEKEEAPIHKAGYINIAILIYGMINIGIIVAIALMK